ncbi:hypothetical protein GCM10027052_27510 [Parafrigoribacterium mesophilum]|uniref:hypothetical protein n=1 Tax=Parafrigoribacterium mesophilum TaxID=433646 RepID=UPI0031FE2A37
MLTRSDAGHRTAMLLLTGKRLIAVHCAGTVFLAEADMATIFLRHALDILTAGGSGLVPLRHLDGLELLLITPATATACWYDRQTLADLAEN